MPSWRFWTVAGICRLYRSDSLVVWSTLSDDVQARVIKKELKIKCPVHNASGHDIDHEIKRLIPLVLSKRAAIVAANGVGAANGVHSQTLPAVPPVPAIGAASSLVPIRPAILPAIPVASSVPVRAASPEDYSPVACKKRQARPRAAKTTKRPRPDSE